MPFYPTQIRLPREYYLGPRICFVTICCRDRRPVFGDIERGHWVLSRLLQVGVRLGFTMHAYCVMPDHLHFVAEGMGNAANLVKLVENLKQRTGYEYRRSCGKTLWQTRYYDHILRRNDPTGAVACYIWWNPVRAGLCAKPAEYQLFGSQTIEWMKAATEAATWRPPWKQVV